MPKKDAKYKFDTNLKSASCNKELEHAKKEWKVICKEKRDKQDGLCICQRKIKNIIYMYNLKTKKTIIVGLKCHEKFNMENSKVNTILSTLLNNHIEKGEYLNINNIITYCKSIEEQLLKYIQDELTNLVINFHEDKIFERKYCVPTIRKESDYVPKNLIKLSENINILIKEYKFENLKDIYSSVCNRINEIYKENKRYEESKIYCVNVFTVSWSQYQGTNYSIYHRYYTSIDKCNEYISKCPNVGITVFSAPGRWWSDENTYIKFEILCKNKIIEIIGEEVYEKYKECEFDNMWVE